MSEKAPATRFYISDEVDSAHFLDGSSGVGRKTFVSRNRDLRLPLYLFNNLRIKTQMRIFLGDTEIEAPQKVKSAIADYLERQAEGKLDNVDCYAFTCLMEGLSIPERDANDRVCEGRLDRWDVVGLDDAGDNVQSGDVLFFWNGDGGDHFQFRHAAVYLGFGMYVSVYGLNGELFFSNFDDLEETFFDDVKKKKGYSLYVTKMIPKAQ